MTTEQIEKLKAEGNFYWRVDWTYGRIAHAYFCYGKTEEEVANKCQEKVGYRYGGGVDIQRISKTSW